MFIRKFENLNPRRIMENGLSAHVEDRKDKDDDREKRAFSTFQQSAI